ncbi:adenylosuccinate synthase [Dialister invisus]|uniref:adenylosuccinate synthase n=1 Tax=Dialister invisus TaxID=218538 RepID=UPI00265D7C59|nr:adenylosuccinate synthase [Dialister invisus]
MATAMVIGAQWGDEGKGKIVDYLAAKADVVVRSQGGNNAGHTVVTGGKAYPLRLMPSGIMYPGTICVVGTGVVIDPKSFLEEMEKLEAQGINAKHLQISTRAQVVFPYHIRLDEAEEMRKGSRKLGTTKNGIGPCYADKINRIGIRMCDLMDKEVFAEKLKYNVEQKNILLEKLYGMEGFDYEQMLIDYLGYAEKLRPYVKDTNYTVQTLVREGKNVLFEGAQASMLDCDNGTYPFVTSSHPTAGGACIGAGIGPHMMQNIFGVVKAYSTRVGEGPFPTEQVNEIGDRIRDIAHEFGTVTGRPRRVGWLDARAVRYAAALNSFDYLAITRLDILDELEEIKVCVGYEYEGKLVKEYPADLKFLSKVTPVYKTYKGWKEKISAIRDYDRLPALCKEYLADISKEIGVPIGIVSVGPSREETIVVKDVF